MLVTRRILLASASALPVAALASSPARQTGSIRRAEPVPARHVRLLPSPFADAAAANRRYLLSLDPERLLHNFYESAGMPAPKPRYGGWEAQGIAGHTLGHWLSACALEIANTGDAELRAKISYAVSEMARIQRAHGDGYCAGTTVERNGHVVDGKVVFEELRRGDIRTQGFDLNGGWVPIYTWHKVHAGLLDAHALAGTPLALGVALGVAGYLHGVLAPLTDDQIQRVLSVEQGGIAESYAETFALTGDPRWLRLAERLRHKAVLEPLAARQDRLAGLHANTQIPKVIGSARLHELTGAEADGVVADFFQQAVREHHSYVIGGNSEREHFGPADVLSDRITGATCEGCNSYNMLKLTRHVYSWRPSASWFDFYERVQLNHILAQQRPDDGAFVYFMPLASGARRTFSSADDSFWCCVGTGMESHAKHADSIYWTDPRTLFVNLYIPSRLDLPGGDLALTLEASVPWSGAAKIVIDRAPHRVRALALRIPAWTRGETLALNGRPIAFEQRDGYAVVTRRWRAGDVLCVTLPMRLTVEPTPDDPALVAFLHGPTVLAADVGAAADPEGGPGPAIAVDGPATAAVRDVGANLFLRDALGKDRPLRPFFSQYDRRTAIYFPTYTTARWSAEKGDYLRRQAEASELALRTVDIVYFGEQQPEHDHGFAARRSEAVNWNGRSARRLRQGERMTVALRRRPGAAILRVTLWGGAVDRDIDVNVDGTALPTIRRPGPMEERFVDVDLPLPDAGTQGRPTATVTFSATRGEAVVYEVRILAPPGRQPPMA